MGAGEAMAFTINPHEVCTLATSSVLRNLALYPGSLLVSLLGWLKFCFRKSYRLRTLGKIPPLFYFYFIDKLKSRLANLPPILELDQRDQREQEWDLPTARKKFISFLGGETEREKNRMNILVTGTRRRNKILLREGRRMGQDGPVIKTAWLENGNKILLHPTLVFFEVLACH